MSVMKAKEFVKLNRELALLNIKIKEHLESADIRFAAKLYHDVSSMSEEFLDEVIVQLENKVPPEEIDVELLERSF